MLVLIGPNSFHTTTKLLVTQILWYLEMMHTHSAIDLWQICIYFRENFQTQIYRHWNVTGGLNQRVSCVSLLHVYTMLISYHCYL